MMQVLLYYFLYTVYFGIVTLNKILFSSISMSSLSRIGIYSRKIMFLLCLILEFVSQSVCKASQLSDSKSCQSFY